MGANGSRQHVRPERVFLHVDMDAFYASVELLEHPELLGKPVAVGADSERSVISSASYEARARGVRSAMSVAMAKKLCPELVLLPVSMEKYRVVSRQVMAVFTEFTPLVEPLSIDEAFLDVTGAQRLMGQPREIADALRKRVYAVTGLPCSVGIANTKFVAKLASQRAKPNGVLQIEAAHTLDFLHSLPVEAMWGVGRATEEKLRSRGINTVAELADAPIAQLKRAVGDAAAQKLHDLANGRDPREVNTERIEKSVSSEETFAHDLTDTTPIMREILKLSKKTAARMRGKGFMARTITLKVKFADFSAITRSQTLPEPTDSSQRIYETACELFEKAEIAGRAVRLIGVGGEQLTPAESVAEPLFSDVDDESWRALDRTTDQLRGKFGNVAPAPASLLRSPGENSERER